MVAKETMKVFVVQFSVEVGKSIKESEGSIGNEQPFKDRFVRLQCRLIGLIELQYKIRGSIFSNFYRNLVKI